MPLPRTYSDFAKSRATGVPLKSPPRKVPPSRETGSKLEDGKVFMAVGFDRQTGAIDVAPLGFVASTRTVIPGEDDLASQLSEALTRGRGSFEERRKDAEQKRLDRMYGNGSPGQAAPLQTQSADRGLGRKRLEKNRRQTTGSSRPGTAALDGSRPIHCKINLDGKNLPRSDSFLWNEKTPFLEVIEAR